MRHDHLPLYLHPWKHILKTASVPSSEALLVWHPAQVFSLMPGVLNPHYPRRLPIWLHQRLFPALSWGKSQLPWLSSIVIPAPDHMTDSIKRSGITGNLAAFLMPSVRVECTRWNAQVHPSASTFLVCKGHVLGNKEVWGFFFFLPQTGL